ncbi:hypothetical protein K445DRAFT_7005 [Daldinia sp. EC12]|nr:hypothetical protein K445DRAFT_7005 [Daldinia sp. EC12]
MYRNRVSVALSRLVKAPTNMVGTNGSKTMNGAPYARKNQLPRSSVHEGVMTLGKGKVVSTGRLGGGKKIGSSDRDSNGDAAWTLWMRRPGLWKITHEWSPMPCSPEMKREEWYYGWYTLQVEAGCWGVQVLFGLSHCNSAAWTCPLGHLGESGDHRGGWPGYGGVDGCVDVHTKEGDPAPRLASDSTDNARAFVRSEVF